MGRARRRDRVAALNARGGTHPTGLFVRSHGVRLGYSPDRITRALREWNREGVGLAGLNELGDDQADRIHARHPHWELFIATPNVRRRTPVRLARRGEERTTCNALVWRRDTYTEVWRDELVVKGGRKRPRLAFPVAGLVDEDGYDHVAMAVHFPPGRGPGARRLRRKIERRVEEYLGARTTSPTIVELLGDTNDTSEPVFRSWRGIRLTVDRVLVKGRNARLIRPKMHRHWRGRITDHAGSPSARLLIPKAEAKR